MADKPDTTAAEEGVAVIPIPSDPTTIAAQAARLEAGAARVEAIADKLEDAQPARDLAAKTGAGPAAGDAESEKKATKTKVATGRKKSVRKIVDDLVAALCFISDDTGTVYQYIEADENDKSKVFGFWRALSPAALNHIALHQDVNSSAAKRRDIVERLKATTFKGKIRWGRVQDHEIPCANGILDVTTWEVRPHAPENMLERALPILFEPEASAPTWLKALEYWFPVDTDGGRRGALQEFMGYVCLAHAKYKRAAVLFGGSNTGKSVVPMLAKALVGDDYTCQLSVEDMDDPQRRSVLKGKALNVMTELSAAAMIADGGFKTLISTEEPVMIDAKYIAAEMYTPTAKHIIATNNLPRLNDHTSATFNRLLILPFTEEIAECDQDRTLLEKLKGELPGILRWAAEGARRLVARHGQWPEVEAAREILTSYRDEMNPMRQFMTERMAKDKDSLLPLQMITAAFNAWNTGSKNYTIKYVGKLVRDSGRKVDIITARANIDGVSRVVTCVVGYRLVKAISEPLRAKQSTGERDEVGNEIIEAELAPAAAVSASPADGFEGGVYDE